MNNEKKDKLTEWITRIIEKGENKPLQTPNLQNSNSVKESRQKAEGHRQKIEDSRQIEDSRHSSDSAHKPDKKGKFFKHKNINKQFNKQENMTSNKSESSQHSFNKKQKNYSKNQDGQDRGYPGARSAKPGRKIRTGAIPGLTGKQNTQNIKPDPNSARQKAKNAFDQAKEYVANAPKTVAVKSRPQKTKAKTMAAFKGLRIIPIGGLNEVGKNMTAYEYNATGRPQDKQIIVIDIGLQFPEEDMLGVDYVIPDPAYLEENQKYIKAVVITHGHLDHIGGIPYILQKIGFPPVYATKLTRGLIEARIEEFKLTKFTRLHTIDPKENLKFGAFMLEFFRVAHSIPDSVGIVISTPNARVVHTGDFKFDDSPAGIQPKADIDKIQALGGRNVTVLLSDSTNALKPGHTMSEADIGENLGRLITAAKGRIIIASFSSLIGRIQQIFEYAEKTNRKIYISGRSMKENVNLALKLGYLKIHTSLIRDIKNVSKAPDGEVLIMTTGSQGEAVSALTKIAMNEHPQVHIKKGDTVIVSSTPIIGNERSIFTVINSLNMLGAKVIHHQISAIHTSGHGYQEELKQMIRMVRPKYFAPVHGEYFMRQAHKELAIECGIPEQNCVIVQNGGILEIPGDSATLHVSKETVEAKYILIDGLGEGTIGSQVMIERQKMSQNGILLIVLSTDKKTHRLTENPNILSRGFIYMHEYDEITKEISALVADAYKQFLRKKPDADRKEVKRYIEGVVERYSHQKLERRPLIVPIVFER